MKKKNIIFLSIIGVIILSGIIAYVVKNNKDSVGNKGKEEVKSQHMKLRSK